MLRRLLQHKLICPNKSDLLILVNVKADERSVYSSVHKKIIFYNNLGDIKNAPSNATLFIEDIIHLNKKLEIELRYYLNEFAHHRKLKIFCVGHTLFKTSLFGVVSLFNYIVFTSCTSNLALLKQTLTSFMIEPDEAAEYLEKFQVLNKPDYYYYLNCGNMQFKFMCIPNLDSDSDQSHHRCRRGHQPRRQNQPPLNSQQNFDSDMASKKMEKQLVERGKVIFEDHRFKSKAIGLLSILALGLPHQCFRLPDLTVAFRNRHLSTPKRVSLIDYIDFLLTPQQQTSAFGNSNRPKQLHEFSVLHNFVSSHCILPDYMILNKNV